MLIYDNLTNIVGTLILISASSERVVEIIKGYLPTINEKKKATVYSSIALFVAYLISFISDIKLNLLANQPVEWLLIALASCAGSGVWHDVSKIISGLKK